ncbi:MAG: hypothetical protein JWP63_3126, partial [Candidatus Solibacter sp.]|nr:hypothetical protein [Candidatus Solibacter sp.]
MAPSGATTRDEMHHCFFGVIFSGADALGVAGVGDVRSEP